MCRPVRGEERGRPAAIRGLGGNSLGDNAAGCEVSNAEQQDAKQAGQCQADACLKDKISKGCGHGRDFLNSDLVISVLFLPVGGLVAGPLFRRR